MTAEMSVQITLALKLSPSAGIGRQDKLKLYWYKIVNVQVVSRIKIYLLKIVIFLLLFNLILY